MTPEEQRIAIAEACGYVKCDQWITAFHPLAGLQKNCSHVKCYPIEFGPKKYDEDLNAMHEAESELGKTKQEAMGWELWRVLVPGQMLYHATAAQRAEAFLKTIGKWKD